MRQIVGFAVAFWFAALPGCCRPCHHGPPSPSGPCASKIGLDWDDGPSSGSFKLVVCFAASPCQLIEIDAVNKQYAADIAEEIVTLWNDRFPAEGDQASLCGTDIVMFPENKVADIAVVDNGAFKRIPVSGLTLSNGVNVRKVSGCPY